MTRTALVLGGGGLTGIGWEIGMLKGLADAGLDLSLADIIVGTSAGSVVGTVISTHGIEEAFATQLEPGEKELGAEFGPMTMLRLAPLVLMPGSGRRKRRRIGAAAMRAHRPGGEERIEIISSRIDVTQWPDRDLRITAVDAESGAFKVFGPDSGVDIVRAVAASCAVPLIWPSVAIDGHQYIDGGMRSTANVDIASDADVIVVLAPLPQAYSRSSTIGAQLARTHARATAVITPDRPALTAFGSNLLDASKRTDAAWAGVLQSAEEADKIRQIWPATRAKSA